jgi:hypothetical protein
MKTKHFAIVVLAFLALAGASAFANDQITSSVTPLTGPTPVIVNNGVPSGTIQLWYTNIGTSFPCGTFATFTLNLQDAAGSGQHPSYPVALNLAQSGNGTPVQLSANPSAFSVSDATWNGSSTVTVSIDCTKLEAPADGQDIVGNLNVSTAPSGSHLDTISTIQVHIKLVIPSATACLKLYSFVTDPDTGLVLDTISVVKNHAGNVTATNPGIVSADGLVVNACPDPETFGLGIGLDISFSTNPSNNAGNATFTYNETGELDPSASGFTVPTSGGTVQGETLCLNNVTLASGDSYLATVHSQINSGISASSLPVSFQFGASLSTASTSCSPGSYLPTSLVSPNPATSTLPYNVH